MPLSLLLGLAALQGPSPKSAPEPAPPTSVAATRAAIPPVIDGKDDDAVWQQAPRITQFRVFRPTDGAIPKFQTEARVAFDAHNLYVFVRAFDPHPDSIVALLARRDVMTPSDVISIFIDSYHDRRTGYEFDVNPAGVKVDAAIFQDGNEDMAWDGVWEVATRIDLGGWTAEYRFPLSQLRYAVGKTTFGFTVARQVERTGESSSWPPYHTSQPGLASQLGELTGLDDLAAPKRTELMPYVVTKNVSVPTATGFAIGVIDAVTQHETGAGGLTVEPTTNYAVVRTTQDLRNGGSGIGLMFTGVDRSLDSNSAPYLHRTAYAGAFDLRHRFLHNRFEISTSVDLSHVAGSPAAILGTQLDPVHFYQRPDGPLHVDSSATSLSGDAEEVHFGKISGDVLFETSYLRRSPGFEINDLGFLLQADQQSWNTWMGGFVRKPNKGFRQLQWNLHLWQQRSAPRLST